MANHNLRRTELRRNQLVFDQIRISAQTCRLQDNIVKLKGLLLKGESKSRKQDIKGLLAILEILTQPANISAQTSYKGYMEFSDAYSLFSDFHEVSQTTYRFRDILLDPDIGLCVYDLPINGLRFILLRPDNIGLEGFFSHVQQRKEQDSFTNENMLEIETCQSVISTMDTEYDKQCAKSLLMLSNGSKAGIERLGIKADTAMKAVNKVLEVCKEKTHATNEAKIRVSEGLDRKITSLQKELTRVNLQLVEMEDIFTSMRTSDLEARQNMLDERLRFALAQKKQENKNDARKFMQSVKRVADNILEAKQIKRRKKGAGAHRKLDSDDEDYIAKCIEDKCTAHGRRHDAIQYLHHRLRHNDLLSIANHRLLQTGRKAIRSETTVRNRGKPKYKRSRQARSHIGKSLFCVRKPPKTEDNENELTHHQRAHVRNAKSEMSGIHNEYCLFKSTDDKAYLRPGTSCGIDKLSTLQPINPDHQRQLPKYDWVTPEVYCTPGTHRIFTCEQKKINEKEVCTMKNDSSICMMRPKHYIGSNGTVWASEDMRIRHEMPYLYEVESPLQDDTSYAFRAFCAILQDKITHFLDATNDKDLSNVTFQDNCQYRNYELNRLSSLLYCITLAKSTFTLQEKKMKEKEVTQSKHLLLNVDLSAKDIYSLKKNHCHKSYDRLKKRLTTILTMIKAYSLPRVRPRIVELTDAGPGVGVSNIEVRIRSAEKVRIHNLDRLTRIHRSRGDSGQNEAERTNALIGNAISDGGGIKWEYFRRFEGMSKAQKDGMTSDGIIKHESERMEKNAWKVAEDLQLRVNDAPAPHGFIRCFVTNPLNQQFFTDREYLMNYMKASKKKRETMPGHGYYSKLLKFIEAHFQIGELFLEFLRFQCKDEKCHFCSSGWNGPICTHIRRPYPDYSRSGFHYLSASETPLLKEDTERGVDDFQPRAQLKKLHSSKLITSNAVEKVDVFSKIYLVPQSLVLDYLGHLDFLEMKKAKRLEKKRNISLSSQDENEISESELILDTIGLAESESEENNPSSESDVILDTIGTSESEDEESDPSSESDVESIFTQTRSGRVASTWKSKKYL